MGKGAMPWGSVSLTLRAKIKALLLCSFDYVHTEKGFKEGMPVSAREVLIDAKIALLNHFKVLLQFAFSTYGISIAAVHDEIGLMVLVVVMGCCND
jgi:hypothetical protein